VFVHQGRNYGQAVVQRLICHTRFPPSTVSYQGRSLTGMLYVDEAGIRSKKGLTTWVKIATDYASTLPPKTAKPTKV